MFPTKADTLKGTLFVIAFVGICAQIPFAERKYLAPQDVISSQVEDDLRSAVEVNERAKTAEEWESSGFTPAEVFQGIHALKSQTAWKTACSVLLRMKPRELVLFESEINEGQNAQNLKCHPQLTDRIRAYWTKNRLALAALYPQAFFRDGYPMKEGVHGQPSAEKRLDAHMSASGTDLKDFMKPGEVALLFDGGPESQADRTSRVLSVLKDEGVRAMFVIEGKKVAQNQPTLARMKEQGHIVGATSYDKMVLPLLDTKTAEKEINDGRASVSRGLGKQPQFFRFPFEASNDYLEHFVDKLGVMVMAPSVDSEDWKIHEPKALLKSIIAKLDKNHGGILELHDGNEQTVQILPALLAELRTRSFSTVVLVPSGDGGSTVAQR